MCVVISPSSTSYTVFDDANESLHFSSLFLCGSHFGFLFACPLALCCTWLLSLSSAITTSTVGGVLLSMNLHLPLLIIFARPTLRKRKCKRSSANSTQILRTSDRKQGANG